jgi:hypothetical protein
MALSNILSFVQTQLATVPSVGLIHAYERLQVRPEDVPGVFIWPTSGEVRAWTLTRESTESQWQTNKQIVRRHALVLRCYMQVNDQAASEVVFQTLLETVWWVFAPIYKINDQAELLGPMQIEGLSYRFLLADTLVVHYGECRLVAQERVTVP